MSEELKTNEVPILRLDFGKETAPAVSTVKEEVILTEETRLTVQEEQIIEEFIPKIEFRNPNLIHYYGSGAQKKIAGFSENVLASVRTKDMGEVGEMLTGVVTELKGFGAGEEKGFLGIFKKSRNKLAAMKAGYDKVEGNINKICEGLESHQIQLLQDTALLEKMYDLNRAYFKELSLYIIAGKRKLEMVRAGELRELTDQAKQTGLPEDAQAANDLDVLCNRFEKKLHDLELTRMISIQTAPQIRLVQGNNVVMTDKIQSTLVNTIPLWKSQMILALGVEHSRQAAAAQRQVTDMTNELLRKNADTLKMATVETARESERGIVDMETLRHTNQSLISTLDEVMKIHDEGRTKRREAEAELSRLEGELKQKLLEIRG